MIATDPLRLAAAAGVVLVYMAMCALIAFAQLQKRRAAAALEPAGGDGPAWLVAYASQTGTAEDLAWQTASTLHLAGVPAHLCSLSELGAKALGSAERILFVASTYGEGDPPDNAAAFAGRLMEADLPLGHLHYALLALGDSRYDNFCGFGRALDGWLRRQGAQPLFERIEVDCCDPAALESWRQSLSHLAGTRDAPDWSGPEFSDWRLVGRRLLNPGSVGEPVFHLDLAPAGGCALPAWHSGDLVQVLAPGDMQRPREYSIASIPADGGLQLMVRLHRHPDGGTGVASGWLTRDLAPGGLVRLRLRAHRLFRLGDNAGRPLILIGNGTGLAGLRSHLKARAAAGESRNWLIFGERNAAHDFHYRDELEAWQADGVLARLDMVFSRDQVQRRHVQDCLLESGEALRAWVEQGAAIYVCGSLEGMAGGVDDALADQLGRNALDELAAAGRYRRDVY